MTDINGLVTSCTYDKHDFVMGRTDAKGNKMTELDRLKKYSTEADLIKIVQEIDDKIIFRGYNNEQVLSLVNELVKVNLLSVKYETREEILHLLCDIISYYGKFIKGNWKKIIDIKDKLEDDLKEYITEFMELI